MPNHVMNRLSVDFRDASPDEVKSFWEAVSYPGCPLGFISLNRIIPMPESLNIEEGSRRSLCLDAALRSLFAKLPYSPSLEGQSFPYYYTEEEYQKSLSLLSEAEKQLLVRDGNIYLMNILQYGYSTWYEWCYNNWGTKWETYGNQVDKADASTNLPQAVSFSTAWTAPVPVFITLSRMYPEYDFNLRYADEGIPDNCGIYEFRGGRAHGLTVPNPEIFGEALWSGPEE